jgi:hypothetical protein
MRLLRSLAIIVAAGAVVGSASAKGVSANGWAEMTLRDVRYVLRTNTLTNIYAILGDEGFRTTLDAATREAIAAASQVRSLQGYQAVLKRYIGSLQDPHSRIRFSIMPSSVKWTSFLVRMRGDRFYVVGSRDPRIVDGAELTECDGRPINQILDRMAPLEGTITGLQSTRAAMARLLTVDADNPFYARPTRCTIAGVPVSLAWSPITTDALAVANAAYAPFKDDTIWSKPFGSNGAWVHMGVFFANPAQADQYHALYAALPTLRNKDVIVVDVRGNSGGSYNWFMGFLRALYGDDYVRYYARARLKIRAVYAADPSLPDPVGPGVTIVEEPHDTELEQAEGRAIVTKASDGQALYHLPPVKGSEDPTEPPPPNPVQARVLVLTDNGCASACIAFVDEMLRFPGVEQIGADTFVDRLSGTPVTTPLPSGNGTLGLPSMIRYGRLRGDNEPREPTIKFDGDLADTPAVQAWIVNSVLKPR